MLTPLIAEARGSPTIAAMTRAIPRYLCAFHPKGVPHYFTDILIIGGGLAGLRGD